MTGKILKITSSEKLEEFGTIPNITVIPRKGEWINVLSNRFEVEQVEWYLMNDDVYIYIKDINNKGE